MVFRRSNLRLRPVKSLKHIVDIQSAVLTSGVTVAPIIETTSTPALGSTTEVADGSTISAIYLRVEALTTVAHTLQPAFYMIVYKDPGNNLASDPLPALTGISENKRWVIHQEMVMLAKDPAVSSFPRTVFNGVIRIPPRLKRFGYSDKLKVRLSHSSGETTGESQFCLQSIYKEFR